ncbi:MAG: hypothetical protein LBI73_14780 [Myroides sp.]|jgi:hypothetical protein|nr:hypothetical protein [Myroides sp.]
MKKTKPLVSKNFKKLSILFFTLFSCILSFGQKKHINDIILVDATQLKIDPDITRPIIFSEDTNEWTIEFNKNDIFIFKVIKEINLKDIPSKYQILPLNSFIDDSISRYEKLNGKKPGPPHFGGTHIETMVYKNLYLKINHTQEHYYKVSVKYKHQIWN